MLTQFSRTELLLGKEGMERLKNARVAVFGVGGVGGYVCEALVRSGVFTFDLIDDDKVCLTNLNRQLIAMSSIGRFGCSSEYTTLSFFTPRFFNSRRITFASGHTFVL